MHKSVQKECNMKNKPSNLTPDQLSLVKDTCEVIILNNEIDDREMEYLHKLYWVIYDKVEDDDVVINDLLELSKWVIKDVR